MSCDFLLSAHAPMSCPIPPCAEAASTRSLVPRCGGGKRPGTICSRIPKVGILNTRFLIVVFRYITTESQTIADAAAYGLRADAL